MHSVPVPINVRCYSNNDVIVRRGNVTQRAMKRLMHCTNFEKNNGTHVHGTHVRVEEPPQPIMDLVSY
jgi:hypothetical protein